MITQIHKTLSIDTTGTDVYFVIAKSEEELYNEINRFVEKYKSDDNSIWCSIIPVKPSKVNLRPEYSAELQICQQRYDGLIHLCQRRVW